MKYLQTLALALFFVSGSALAECVLPEKPELPDGANASYDDMIAGQQAVKDFQEANLEYMSCIEKEIKDAESEAKNKKASKEDRADAVARHSEAVEKYNAAVSQEEEVAGQFNTEIREYKAANSE